MGKVDLHLVVDEEDARLLGAMARERGCTRSEELHHLLQGEEPAKVTIARLRAEEAASRLASHVAKQAAARSRAEARVEAVHYKQIMLGQRLHSRYVLALLRAGKPPPPPF
jgi:uncharacterized protein YceH (UPF0502 family)